MKKSLVVVALVCGAVVFVAACGGKKTETEPTCKSCTIIVDNRTINETKPSTVHANGQYCDDALKAFQGLNGGDVSGADATDGKGGKYKVTCN